MTVTINGTTGITNDGGYTGDGVVFADTTPANTLVTTTGGNVGVGTATPTDIAGYNSVTVASTTGGWLEVTNGTVRGALQNGSGDVTLETRSAHPLIFGINGAEKARIDTGGNFLVNTATAISSSSMFQVVGSIASHGYTGRSGTSGSFSNIFNINWTGSTAQLWIDTTNVGTISLTSDYRIKQKIETQTAPALERVMQLRPVTYELQDYRTLFKADGVAREGFIAHELQTVIPSAVEGEKDAENQVQSLKLDALVSVLTKAIQEQQAIILAQQTALTALTARVEALDARLISLEGTQQ